ncbi:MAG: hypothetical protein JOS17DRAFT_482353 [Linnemannia elongata]|nr:MAG: hypothetical protein JOS17DRAFT_482353 [Linnemannia elongata]
MVPEIDFTLSLSFSLILEPGYCFDSHTLHSFFFSHPATLLLLPSPPRSISSLLLPTSLLFSVAPSDRYAIAQTRCRTSFTSFLSSSFFAFFTERFYTPCSCLSLPFPSPSSVNPLRSGISKQTNSSTSKNRTPQEPVHTAHEAQVRCVSLNVTSL